MFPIHQFKCRRSRNHSSTHTQKDATTRTPHIPRGMKTATDTWVRTATVAVMLVCKSAKERGKKSKVNHPSCTWFGTDLFQYSGDIGRSLNQSILNWSFRRVLIESKEYFIYKYVCEIKFKRTLPRIKRKESLRAFNKYFKDATIRINWI